MNKLTFDFIKAIPKTDLHIHLDGSLRLSSLIDIAKKNNIELPSYTEEGLKELVFKEHYASLVEYLHGFKFTCAALQTAENLERASYELAMDALEDGVRYLEVRFAPQLHINPILSMEDVLTNVNKGLERATKEINQTKGIKSGKEPKFAYGIIACALRMFTRGFSDYYMHFTNVHKYCSPEERYALASLELARGIIKIRDEMGIPIVGFDLAGEEKGFPAENHREAYHYVHKNFMKKTVHAGEAYGAASIFQAITDLYADRIGHGTYLFDTTKIDLPDKQERDEYIANLSQIIADRRTTIEICLTSNAQTNPEMREIKKHPCKLMLDNKLSVTFCTDNTLISSTSTSKELKLAVDNFNLDSDQLKDIIAYGFKRSFYPGKYEEKRQYVRDILNYYEALESEHLK